MAAILNKPRHTHTAMPEAALWWSVSTPVTVSVRATSSSSRPVRWTWPNGTSTVNTHGAAMTAGPRAGFLVKQATSTFTDNRRATAGPDRAGLFCAQI